MLYITVPTGKCFDEATNEFIYTEEHTLQLEHSLVSLSKWESKWNKPFLTNKEKTDEETLDYIRCMTLTPNVDPLVYMALTNAHKKQIIDYIEAPMTATTFSDGNKTAKGGRLNGEIITSELIYYWMTALNINYECQYWHLNRLITLIRVCSVKNQPPGKKKSTREINNQYAAMNAARRKMLNSKG